MARDEDISIASLIGEEEKKSSKGKKLMIIVFVLFLLSVLAAAGFAAGVYFKILNVQNLSTKYKLYSYPVIGKYFPKPPELTENAENKEIPPLDNALPAPPPLPLPVQPKISPEELAKQEKEKKEAEKKRIAKLARLYSAMKPEEVVPIMDKLTDNEVLDILGAMEDEQMAKILPLFTPERAARLTQIIMRGRQTNPQTPQQNQRIVTEIPNRPAPDNQQNLNPNIPTN